MESLGCQTTTISTALLFFCLALSTSLHSQAMPEGETGDPSAWLPFPPPSLQSPPEALPSAQPNAAPGTIQRVTKQQILITIPANAGTTSQPFITSPSGSYVGCLVRHTTAPAAGGIGSDVCYIRIQDTGTEASVWESACSPVSSTDACSVVFSDTGLEVFDGNRPAWDTGVDAGHLETLELVDEGDMRIKNHDGEIVWKASDKPLVNQKCGLATGVPSFATPSLGGSSQGGVDGQQGLGANIPFDSASSRISHGWLSLALIFLLVEAHGFLV